MSSFMAGAERPLRPLRRALSAAISRHLARRLLRTMERATPAPFATTPPEGFRRGIDHYTRQDLIAVLQNVLASYRRACGRYPDLARPRSYSEKVSHAKFFAPIKVPESGNKLLTGSFLPPALAGQVSVPEVVWHHDQPQLPANGQLEPGEYYLKASHGSDMVQRIRFPLEAGQREALEATCRRWLSRPFGLGQGEWWYNSFPRRLLIERSISSRIPSLSLLFYVLGGEVALITVFAKALQPGKPNRRLLLDGRFVPLAEQDPAEKRLADFQLSEPLQRRCLEVARTVAGPLHSVRVDLMVGDDGRIYLNEVTFSPSNGLPFVGRDLDLQLGQLWPGTSLWR
ncbi:ATP-grasp fold amidoligase family protein [Synechococcus sp. BO 8801]|uniref:ATP-grasp fold amidoligase family protein n=1 Tax=Synechococcus sp. BO 8801 TaxID=169670 RepID=UPI00117E84BF|nr:ATP-grasp fold amidoligase family protein [Synechococcus sp. BO 8801]